MDIGKLSNLKVMKVASQALAESFGGLKHLEHLDLTSLKVESLPQSFKQLSNLQTLAIGGSRIRELDFGRGEYTSSLCNLQKIRLSETEVYKISISEDCCPRLKIVEVLRCSCLREVEILPETVEIIHMEKCPELISFLISPNQASLKTIYLYNLQKIKKIENLQDCCTSLEQMTIKDCPQLNALPNLGRLVSLKKVELEGLHKIEMIEGLQNCTYTSSLCNLQKIKLRETEVFKISISGDCCPHLKIVELQWCGCLREVEILPKTVEIIHMAECSELIAFLISPNQASLKTIYLYNLQKIKKTENLQDCTSLEQMTIKDCPQLNALPNLGRLVSLKKIALEGLDKIESIDGLQQCTSLDYISLKDCKQLSELSCFEKLASLYSVSLYGLPKIEKIEGLQNCTSLRCISIVDCPSLRYISLVNCTSLRCISIGDCPQLSVLVCFENLDSLDEFSVKKCKKVVAIGSSGQMQFLEPCIPEKHKLPAGGGVEMLIRTRAMPDTGSVINPSDFPSLSILHSFEKKKIPPVGSSGNGRLTLKGRGAFCSNGNAAMLYLIINCVSQYTKLGIMEEWHWWRRVQMEDGRWILICTLSLVMSEDKLSMLNYSTSSIEVDEGLLLMGDPNDISEAFWRTIARLGN